jgi:SlyX protein
LKEDERAAWHRRLEELESRLAFQDDLIESLNDVVSRQDIELSRMSRRLDSLTRKLEELSEAAVGAAAGDQHEIPPHY